MKIQDVKKIVDELKPKYLKKINAKLVKGEYKSPIKGKINSPEQVYDIFKKIKDKSQETLISLYLNNDLEVLSYNVLSVGSGKETIFPMTDIFGFGFVMRAKYIILIHNHPSGNPNPSKADNEAMKKLTNAEILETTDMKVIDFIIVGDMDKKNKKQNYWSMFEEDDGGEYSLGSI